MDSLKENRENVINLKEKLNKHLTNLISEDCEDSLIIDDIDQVEDKNFWKACYSQVVLFQFEIELKLSNWETIETLILVSYFYLKITE
ncbi:uncharacterized protein ASCRUDRAFT_78121 [Ascoidea rubescens DSM 1968]|uniref:Uncharacterized protein n=1 Tax=Ascoidea rubescens DSM 1968 TaxID=1344418 RepID=A0A1D2V970_9ASCO|nr:hypothetical protein ASCRUDRAFT_78121 [Ascoidea rubescens DSM 1968]ODV58211.1 hypothetical protein ASCRUDRAFT_78121 [Ascoidea rubescens DSM 1968]